jgi:hypothetical protein
MTVQVGAHWLDIEEEAEVQVVPGSSWSTGPWIVEGTFTVPEGVAITGCMLWNDDTLLMGKLRGKVQAQKIFDSLVPPRSAAWPRDPLLVEQQSETVYGLKLFPFASNGNRRFRLRYLVPRPAGVEALSVRPLMAAALGGSLPANFRLRLRGDEQGLRLVQQGGIWPVDLPFTDLVPLQRGADVKVWWGRTSGGLAARGHVDSGRTRGDYVMFTGTVPDSILRRDAIRSETVVLWRWVQPRSFLYDCSWGSNVDRCLSAYGQEAIAQAGRIGAIADRTVANGGRIGLLADQGLDDTVTAFPLADSAQPSFQAMKSWLGSIGEAYLEARIPASGGGGLVPGNVDIARSRERFRVDVREAGALYSRDSGVIRHLLVVTAGVEAASGQLEKVDAGALPADVSVASSRLILPGYSWTWVQGTGYVAVPYPPAASRWPGIDLDGLVASRPGTGNLVAWEGIDLPRVREFRAARLAMASESGWIRRNVSLTRNASGRLGASLNVHGVGLGKSLRWSLFDEAGKELSTWDETPQWVDAGSDPVLPKLWAKSESPLSPVFQDQDLGPLFGVVDPFHSLLATPSDTVGAQRQAALRDSGVPFLSYSEIFPRQGFGGEGDGDPSSNAVVVRTVRAGLELSWIAGTRTLRISLEGIQAQAIEIRDLRGRIVGVFTASQLAGLKSLDWQAPAGLGRGMLLVSVRTATGLHTGRVMMP